jgi:hypothetical protein
MTLQFIIVMIVSAINDRLQRKLDYVEEERRILREQLDAARYHRNGPLHGLLRHCGQDPRGGNRWDRHPSRWKVDAANGAQPDRLGGRHFSEMLPT